MSKPSPSVHGNTAYPWHLWANGKWHTVFQAAKASAATFRSKARSFVRLLRIHAQENEFDLEVTVPKVAPGAPPAVTFRLTKK